MRVKRGFSLSVTVALGALTAAASASAQATQSAASPPAADSTSDIIVTAQRRAERAQDVPIAITAFSSERLEQQGIAKEQDLQASVPSLVVGPNGNYSRESQSFTIRGQGATFQASPGVVVYLNEVPLPASITLGQQGGPGNFVDLENLQVLSGPQGTLFGRNTTGGAVLLVAKKPTNQFGGWVQGRIGNYETNELEGALNVPIIDNKLLVRAVGAYHDRRGYTHDVIWNKDRDNVHWYSGRLGITFRPTDTIENYTMLYGSRSKNNGIGFIHKQYNLDALRNLQFCYEGPTIPGAIASCDVYRAADAQAAALGNRKTAPGGDNFSTIDTWGVINNSSIELSNELTLRNIISYQRIKLDYSNDVDATVIQQHDVDAGVLPAPGQAFLPHDGTPLSYFNAFDPGRPRDDLGQFTEELQLQAKMLDSKLTWTAGAFYYHQKPESEQAGGVILYCPAAFTGFCPSSSATYGSSQKSKALYAQGTLDLGALSPTLENLRFTAGLRHTWDDISGFSTSFRPNGFGSATCASTGLVVPIAQAPTSCTYSARLKTDASTWLLGLDYKVVKDVMVYGKVSRGYKSGGFNLVAVFPDTRTFLPETVTSYEAGFKSDFRLGSMPARLNVSGYVLDYKNIQRAGADFNPTTQAGGAVIRNADARIKGVEIEASVRPTRWLEIGGNFSHTDANYKRYQFQTPTGQLACNGIVPAGGTVDLSCLPFQYVAAYIYSAHLDAKVPLANNLGTLNLFVNYSHTSSQYTDPGNLPSVQPGARLEPFGLVNATLDWNNVANKGFDLGLFVTNATNKTYRISNTNVYQAGGLLYQSTLYGEPRMYGMKLRVHFGGQ